MNQLVAIIIGLLGISVGSWLLFLALNKTIPLSVQIWWLPNEFRGKQTINRILAVIVGFGFLILGLFFLVGSMVTNI